jgi:phosphoenolpyruvate-protein kinase (PTS system EI component)
VQTSLRLDEKNKLFFSDLSKVKSLLSGQGQEQFIRGQPLSPGIAIGVLYPVASDLEDLEATVAIDAQGWVSLLNKTKAQLEKQKRSKQLEAMEQSILTTQIEMLNDPGFVKEVQTYLESGLDLKKALGKSLSGWKSKFKEIRSVLFQERIFDLQDVVLRLLKTAKSRRTVKQEGESICLYTRKALPSSILEVPKQKLAAVICESGSIGSHLAILARSRKLPCLSRVHLPSLGQALPVIVDANEGWLILHPSEATWNRYTQKLEENPQKNIKKGLGISCARFWATVNSCSDILEIPQAGIEGIGLVRTEFFAYEHGSLPSMKSQAELYGRLLKSQKGKRVTFRLFDFGSDKPLMNRRLAPEPNPALGCRGIRLLFKESQILKDQLRAILMASEKGPLSIMAPMISTPHEMRKLRKLVETIARELSVEVPQVGMMVEIPAVAFMLEPFMEDSDFFAIGTNDLFQYLFAVDRNNQNIGELYNPLAPAFLHLIDHIVKVCKQHFKPVSICGEMAADPACMLALSRLGLADYSLSLSALKKIGIH